MGLLLSACEPSISTQDNAAKSYFDIRGYFQLQADSLNKKLPRVEKSVIHQGNAESKTVQISNWLIELGPFIESDINKPSWKKSYAVEKSADFIIYTSKEKSLRTKKIVIKLNKKQVEWIMIENYTKNELYASSEKLSYFPGSNYQIKKSQSVRLLGNNQYVINGKLLN